MESSQPARPDSSSVLSIQALRAIAALLVLWGHAINAVNLEVTANFPHLYGPFGVDLFFIISGFVMVYSSERLFGEPRASIKFFARRLARIVPCIGQLQRPWFGSLFHTLLQRRSLARYFSLRTFLRRRLSYSWDGH